MAKKSKQRETVIPRLTSKYEVLNRPDPSADGSLEVNVDYFRGQFDGRSNDFRKALILRLIGNEPAQVIKNSKFTSYQGDHGYTDKITGVAGQTVYWRKMEDGYDIRIELPGSYFSLCASLDAFVRQLTAWQNMGIHATRIDLAITDKNKYLKWEDIADAVETGSYRGFKAANMHHDFVGGVCTGATAYLGSRRSDRYVRIYETSAKHEFAANRIEVEFKNHLCRKVVDELIRNRKNFSHRHQFNTDWKMQSLTVAQALQGYAARTVCGSLDFISRDSVRGNGATAHCPQLDWWKNFVDSVGGQCRICVERVQPTISRTAKWVKRQVSKTLAIIQQGLSREEFNAWMQRTLDYGKTKIKDTDSIALGVLYEHGALAFDDNFDYSTA